MGSGGTMGEYSSYVQTQNERKFTLTPIDTGFILDVKQSDFVKQPIYLVENYYKGKTEEKILIKEIYELSIEDLNVYKIDYLKSNIEKILYFFVVSKVKN